MIDALVNLSSAFGLSSAAGLNAYIPLLVVSILTRTGTLHLAEPYQNTMSSPWFLILMIILCIVEIIVDKIPGADHINDIVQTFIRPTAGAILFASQAGVIDQAHPAVWVTLGLVTSGGVHAVKATARPVINLATFGIGAPVVSMIEDFISTIISLIAVLVPLLVIFVMGAFVWILWRAYKRFFRKSRPTMVHAYPVRMPPVSTDRDGPSLTSASPVANEWSGGL